ncbi:MAG: hypothetical protein AB8C46_08680 [Burkholderiaceae bacterium]
MSNHPTDSTAQQAISLRARLVACISRLFPVLGLTTCLVFTPLSWAQSGDTIQQLSEHAKFSELKSALGREPDSSEAGGACGGIVIHDWATEKIRVITLGESVQAVSALNAESKPSD